MTTSTENVAGAVDALVPLVRSHERMIAEHHLALQGLQEQVNYLYSERKTTETDRYVELRRIIKVIALTEILSGAGTMHELLDIVGDDFWVPICAEVYRCYGHLQFDGHPLWSKPTAPPSPRTKALIAESLKRRQEA